MAELLGFEIVDTSFKAYVTKLIKKYEEGIKTVVVSGNPEVLYTALNDSEVKSLCIKSDIIPDGIGVIISGKIARQHFEERIAGIDIMCSLLSYSGKSRAPIYMLGAKESILKRAVDVCRKKYDADIVGCHNGYFDIDDCDDIIDDINKSNAGILFAAMGCPKQELFIARHMDKLNCSIFMGVGGSFDVLAGKVKRAPKWMINCGMEWLYRAVREPARILRLGVIPKFILISLMYDKRKKDR